MSFGSTILRSALFIGALFLIAHVSLAQRDVLELLPGSDELRYDSKTGLHTLVGNVNFKYQGNIMFCDSAVYSKSREMVWAYGNVHINKRDTLNLFCDELQYDGKTKMAKLKGNVRVRDREYKLTTNELDYDADAGQASYHTGGRVEGTKTREVLTSRVGYFHPETKNFYFSHNVVYDGPEIDMTTDTLRYLYSRQTTYFFGPTDITTKDAKMYCESGWYNNETEEGILSGNAWIARDSSYISGDSLLYLPKQGAYEGFGNVYFMDSTENLAFTGQYAYSSDSAHYTLLTGDPIATKMMEDDTLHIHADTLYNFKLDTVEVLKAYNNAAMYSSKFQSVADSIVYDKLAETIELHTNPIVWSKDAELKGTFMDMHVTDSTIHSVKIYDHATILMEVEPGEYYNQIHGNDIHAFFKDNDLKSAYVYGSAMTISYPEDEEKTDSTFIKKRMGMNRLYSSNIRVDLDSNELVGITYLKQPDGAFYPMGQIVKGEQFVPGFEWKAHLRPMSREDLLRKKSEPEAIIEETEPEDAVSNE